MSVCRRIFHLRTEDIGYEEADRTAQSRQSRASGPSGLKSIHWIDFLTALYFKKVSRPGLMKIVVDYVTAYHGYSEHKACTLTRQHRSTQSKPSVRDPRMAVRQRMHEIAQTRIGMAIDCGQ
jgi:hypothetical protein